MRAIVVVGMMVASTASAADFGIQLGVAEDSLKVAKPPLSRVECNAQRCVYQNPAKDFTAFLGFDDRRTVTEFYVFYQPTNWAVAAEYIGHIQAALKIPAGEIVDVRSVAEAGKDGKRATAISKTISCRSEGDGTTPTIVCERS